MAISVSQCFALSLAAAPGAFGVRGLVPGRKEIKASRSQRFRLQKWNKRCFGLRCMPIWKLRGGFGLILLSRKLATLFTYHIMSDMRLAVAISAFQRFARSLAAVPGALGVVAFMSGQKEVGASQSQGFRLQKWNKKTDCEHVSTECRENSVASAADINLHDAAIFTSIGMFQGGRHER